MKILTCTPIAFGGGADFFARDSGLLCRGLQSIGIESHAVMPLPGGSEDEVDLVRTTEQNLEDPAWWRAQGADGVVLYAWGRPKFRHVAGAIRKAGLFLILNQDNGGLVSPLAGIRDWWKEQLILGGAGQTTWGGLRSARLMARGLSAGLFITDPLRAEHLSHGHIIACVSPKAADYYRVLCRRYGRGLAGRVQVIPHAVEPAFTWEGAAKQRRILCVGRWNDAIQKRAILMTRVIRTVLCQDPEITAVIAGPLSESIRQWHGRLNADLQSRVHLAGPSDRQALKDWMAGSMVFYSPSAFESFGIAAAEALCCGCSVVAADSVSMASFAWFASESSGQLSVRDDEHGHASALIDEFREWDEGHRDAATIAATWGKRLHANEVAAQIGALVRNSGNGREGS